MGAPQEAPLSAMSSRPALASLRNIGVEVRRYVSPLTVYGSSQASIQSRSERVFSAFARWLWRLLRAESATERRT